MTASPIKPRTYLISVASGCEQKVCSVLPERAKALHVSDKIKSVQAPQHPKTTKRKDGTTVTRQEFVFPGYVFAELQLEPEVSDAVLSTPHVLGFVGNRPSIKGRHTNPTPLKQKELDKIFKPRSKAERVTTDHYSEGDFVSINSGPFNGYEAEVLAVLGQKLRLTLDIFGRTTTVEVETNTVTHRQ